MDDNAASAILYQERLNFIERNFTCHPPKKSERKKYEMIRGQAKEFAMLIFDQCPHSRETSLAMTKLEEAVMWANASIARGE